MKRYYLLISLVLIFCNSPTENIGDSNLTELSNSIYKHMNLGNIKNIRIEYFEYLYLTSPDETKMINNTDTIQQIVNLLKALPDSGQIYVKFSANATKNYLILLQSNTKFDTIILINNSIKTPATTFYLPGRDEEKRLVNLIIDTTIQNDLQQHKLTCY